MDKERILEQVRNENNEEEKLYVRNKGLDIGYKIFLALSIVIIIFNLFTSQKSFSVQSLFWGFIAAENYSQFKFFGEKTNKLTAIFAGFTCIVFLINHIFFSLGW